MKKQLERVLGNNPRGKVTNVNVDCGDVASLLSFRCAEVSDEAQGKMLPEDTLVLTAHPPLPTPLLTQGSNSSFTQDEHQHR